MFNHLQTFPNLCENLYLIFGSPKRKSHKVHMNNAPCKFFFKYIFGRSFLKKQKKFEIHMDLWKHGQFLTIQRSLTIKQLRLSKKRLFIWVYHLILHYILSHNNKFGMWIDFYFFFILWCTNQMTNPYI
jgi:hypothetical protein